MTWVVVDAPKVDAANVPRRSSRRRRRWHTSASTAGTPATWNARGGRPPQRFDHLYAEDELREWVRAAARALQRGEEAYAFFNNNNQTNGVAQAPAGAQLLRKLLEEEKIPTA